MQVIDQCYDQGYGSERSPEDEMPPPILGIDQQYNPMLVNPMLGYLDATTQMLEMDAHQRLHQQAIQQNYDFITEGELFFFLNFCMMKSNCEWRMKSFNFHHSLNIKYQRKKKREKILTDGILLRKAFQLDFSVEKLS